MTEIMHVRDLVGLQYVATMLITQKSLLLGHVRWSPDEKSRVHIWKIPGVKDWG